MARLTIHLGDTPQETWIEADGEEVETDAVMFAGTEGNPVSVTLILPDCDVVDHRETDG